ncbi:reverse transcriptase [Cucumis melo var. makuwa]|uniref:Reverse transcriptase n=1 Tax=Cucumis melo var. makuwa TaxID=1194695 RepID=A0A5A7V9H1_CUCMM|nr:reverse transcriptase [Cucumis melo var. makuwa]
MFITMAPNPSKFTPRAQACVFVGYPLHQRGYKCFHPSSCKYFISMDVTFLEDRPFFPVSHLQGESPHCTILPTNQIPWKTYYRRNLRKEVGSPAKPPAPVQDTKPPRDQGMENPTESCTNNTMSENDKSNVAVLENMEEKNNGNETRVRTKTSNNEVEQGHIGKLDEYDPSLDIPIALRKGHKTVGCKWVFSLKYKADGTLNKHKARVLLSVAVNNDWPLYQLDVKNVFLNRDIVEEVYMSPCLDLKPNLSQGYSQGHSDHTIFTKVFKTRKIAVLIVYVDDIVLSGDDQA